MAPPALQRRGVVLGLVGGTWIATETVALKIWGITGLAKDGVHVWRDSGSQVSRSDTGVLAMGALSFRPRAPWSVLNPESIEPRPFLSR